MAEIRRRLASVTPEDPVTGGRPLLYAYGLGYLERIAGRSKKTVRRALVDAIPLGDPAEAVAWAVAKRGRPDLADELLEVLGYARRHAVDE